MKEALRLANTTDPEILGAYDFFKVDRQKFVDDTANRVIGEPGGDDNALKCADLNNDTNPDIISAGTIGKATLRAILIANVVLPMLGRPAI